MTDKDNEIEKRLFEKVTKGIKKKRGRSKGSRCGCCGQNTQEGTEDRHGMWHYRCPYCVTHQNPKDKDPCPRCRCTAHERIGGSLENNPFKPDVVFYRCLNCSLEWNTKEYEIYLLTKVVKSVLPTSEFAKK
jgi:NAD-dependent SIR2 family protein deacetylase